MLSGPQAAYLGYVSETMAQQPQGLNPLPGSTWGTQAQARRSEIMARLTLSALERALSNPELWREPTVHQAVLVSGLTVLMGAMVRLSSELSPRRGWKDSA